MVRISDFRARARRAVADDTGLGIVEVVAAMVVFAIIAVGVAQALVISSKIAGDAQSRTVALNLNTAQLDYVRTQSPYSIQSSSQTAPSSSVTIDGIKYTTFQTVAWTDTSGADRSCGAVDSSFQLLRVRVETVWSSQLTTTPKATSDALISADNTIKDPGNGTIFIKVTKADGSGYANLQLSAKSTSGTALTVPKTNTDGCAFITGVAPGSYTVTADITGNVDRKHQKTSVSQVLNVTAGSAVPVSFDYDVDTSVNLSYPTGQSNVSYPSDLITTWFTSADIPPYYTVSGTPSKVDLFPAPKTGYSAVAGTLVPAQGVATTCLSPDPGNWDAGNVGGKALLDGVRQDPVTALPNTSPNYTVPMGVVQATGLPSNGTYTVVASSAAAASGDPGCAAGQKYTFSIKNNGSPKLALPYGTWSVSYGGLLGLTFPLTAQALTNAYSTSPGSTATLDPRAAA
ncbi:carboxypeptidase-like regulatory domain-containing protein [Schumannella sp. 10F1B-5-1]|uniref:carboxypeptidase-like regulatory domain-containing protein n=1 Tax=Schumannella sp. 10F1B-5-1 TaxID=2590780 RepID=UPI001130DFB3|nr:carboxypeptidase-like regulatory domain-containing protein [Schumannella sp. 10F1B-5-1]TPW71715.1 carboxypeptidase regulatory-like domain-containing protein [Schumannella sp. 10F1B-5-1]